jgi:hypothetical protein
MVERQGTNNATPFEMTVGLGSSLKKVESQLSKPNPPDQLANLKSEFTLLRRGLQRILFEESQLDYGRTLQRYEDLRNSLPREFVKKKFTQDYPGNSDQMLTHKDQKNKMQTMMGAIFEMERINEMRNNPNVAVDFSLTDTFKVAYVGYDEKAKWNKVLKQMGSRFKVRPPHREIIGPLELDVPIRLKGKEAVPYVYEVKDYRMDTWGSPFLRTINQLLKYNSAVQNGQVSGATVEVKGRIAENLLHWIYSKNDHLPNVEIVYTMPLPSGKEYRFILKPSNGSSRLGLETDLIKDATDEDRRVMMGIRTTLRKGGRNLMADVLTKFEGDDLPEGDEDISTNPRHIDRFSNLVRYQYLFNSTIWNRFEKIATEGIPPQYKRS